jgi:hypothetical protein
MDDNAGAMLRNAGAMLRNAGAVLPAPGLQPPPRLQDASRIAVVACSLLCRALAR